MALSKFIQLVGEKKRYEIDYSDWLDTGEHISTVTFSASPTTTPALVGDTLIINPGNTSATFMVSGGTSDNTYKLLITMTTTGGQIKEDVVLFTVREPC